MEKAFCSQDEKAERRGMDEEREPMTFNENIQLQEKTDPEKLSVKESGDENVDRGNWDNKWDYLLSLAGYAIGIGNVWRFPYLCYRNGGGAFLVPYLLMLLMVGIPLFFLESAIGQFSSSGCLTIYSVCPAFKGIGYANILVTLIASTYYSVVIGYPLIFLFHSFTSKLPWASCSNPWNTIQCVLGSSGFDAEVRNRTGAISAADEFFHNEVLQMSSDITDIGGFTWPVVFANVFVWTFAFVCIFKGVKVVGKVVWFTTTFPFVMLFVLLIRGVTLPGASLGIYYYIYPDFNKLKKLETWADAAVQIFFSLGTGWGSLVTMGSYNRFKNNCIRDALLVPVLNCLTSIFAGFVVFSVLGFMAQQTGTSVEEVTDAGPALAFVTYPEALAMMPFAPVWSVLFFSMLFFLGIDSLFVQIETMVASFTDEFPRFRKNKEMVAFVACAIMLFAGLFCCTRGGMYVLQLLDWYSVPLTIICTCLCELFVFSYIYGAGRVVRDIQFMTQKPVHFFWYFMWLVATPSTLMFIFFNTIINNTPVSYRDYVFPEWAQAIGWMTSITSMLAIPIYAIFYFIYKAKGSLSKRLETSLAPTESWGPYMEDNRTRWFDYCSAHPLLHRLLHPAFEDLVSPRIFFRRVRGNHEQKAQQQQHYTSLPVGETNSPDSDSKAEQQLQYPSLPVEEASAPDLDFKAQQQQQNTSLPVGDTNLPDPNAKAQQQQHSTSFPLEDTNPPNPGSEMPPSYEDIVQGRS
ncbi:sodium- and chloride-dependent GABA transporter 1-like [Oratosquilla oratoria]|uniref:sodium- and chloride-dependent GABA transporter 1-like n=1 Tax=Oratosquilla oratoria TaxID=337810 RepID=UPI003F761B97